MTASTAQLQDSLDPAGRAAWADMDRDLRIARAGESIRCTYLTALARLAQHHPGVPLLAMTREHIAAFLLAQAERWRPGTVDTRYRALRRFYRWAEAEGLIKASPMARVPAPRLPQPLVPVLDDLQLRRLLAACAGRAWNDLRDAAIVRLLSEAGAPRASELCAVTLDCLDMTADQVLIRAGKGEKDRLIPFGAATGKALSRYLRARAQHPAAAASGRVFLGKKGPLTRSGLQQLLRRRGAAAGIDGLHPHQLRHTAYHRADAAGLSQQAAERLFGWQPGSKMTRVYGASAAARRAVDEGRALAIGDAL